MYAEEVFFPKLKVRNATKKKVFFRLNVDA